MVLEDLVHWDDRKYSLYLFHYDCNLDIADQKITEKKEKKKEEIFIMPSY